MGEIAFLMAAGMGTRMRPLTEYTPKPLIPVGGKPMIETVIEGLLEHPVSKIYVITGYLAEQFGYLCHKYPRVKLVHNSEYESSNNISSIYAVRKLMEQSDCFICESDLYVADRTIFRKKLTGSCYFGRMQMGYSDDWIFELENNRIIRVGKGGTDAYNMVGISYFKQKDAVILANAIADAYKRNENAQLFWDEIVNQKLDRLELVIEPVKSGQVFEIDTVEELNRINESL